VVALAACAEDVPELPTALDALVLDTLFELGAATGESWQAFEGVWDVEVDAEGRVAILDIGGPAVHVYDARGAHVATLAEKGLQPGRLDRPSGIAWSEPGALLVWDPGSSWVSGFRVTRDALAPTESFRAFAFGETGFCTQRGRTYLSYLLAGEVVHEVGADGPVRSFGAAPAVVGAETLGPELREIAEEELTPSALLCTPDGVVEVSFVQSLVRLHDLDGTELWSRGLDGFRPIVAYSDDGVGLGRAFDAGEGSHLLRSVVAWGRSRVLVQHELRQREFPEEGEVEVIESRLLDLTDGSEVARSRTLPLVLAAGGRRLFLVRQRPYPVVTVVETR
jgi:hypothetical protein